MKRAFSSWFKEVAPEFPDVNLTNIRKYMYKAFCAGFDLAYSRGYRQGYDDCEKDTPEPEPVVLEGAGLNPSPQMIQAGVMHLLDFDMHSPQELAAAEAKTERIWRVMWAAK